MKLLKPFYFDEFACVGGKCKDTCCAGWNITIDDASCKTYQQVQGEFGDKLKKSILCGEQNSFILEQNGNCPFLNSEQLCDIYINLGEDKLCTTCKIYPRITRKYDDIYEQDLTLSCPEVARLLISYNKPIDFCFGEFDDDKEEKIDIEKMDLFNALIAGRGLSVDLMQIDEIPLWKRLYLCLTIADKIQKHIDNGEEKEIQNTLEAFGSEEYIISYLDALEGLKSNTSLKLLQYKKIITIMSGFKIKHRKFTEYFAELLRFFENHNSVEFENNFYELSNKFDTYNENNKAYENYIVYYLFHYYMSAYKEANIYKYIVIMVEVYSLIKLFAMVRWFHNNYQLSEDELIDILYLNSRTIEHREKSMDEIFNEIKKYELDDLAYLAALIR